MSKEQISPDIISPVDFYNRYHIQDAYDIMLRVQNVKCSGIGCLAYVINKGDETKKMIVIENDWFVVKLDNGLGLEVGKKYSPFQLLQKFKFKDNYHKANSFVLCEYMGFENDYIRVGTKYFKKIIKVDRYNVTRTELSTWDINTLIRDFPPSFVDSIPKYDDFTIEPDNENHSPVIGNNYNLYSPFAHNPCTEEEYIGEAGFPWIDKFIIHIFGEQYELGMTYIQTLYLFPKQIQPILVLVSSDRQTGKSTFINFMNILFGQNMVIVNPQDLVSSFNASYADKNIIAIEETQFKDRGTTEKLKSLATLQNILVNTKHVKQYTIPFYGKLIIASNSETRFSIIDNKEIRYWVRKVPKINGMANHDILSDMAKEIPQFLRYLRSRDVPDFKGSRQGLSEIDINTEALKMVKEESKSGLQKDLEIFFEELCEANTDMYEFRFSATDIKHKLFLHNHQIQVNYIRRVLKEDMEIEISNIACRYKILDSSSVDGNGRPFIIKNNLYENIESSKAVSDRISEKLRKG